MSRGQVIKPARDYGLQPPITLPQLTTLLPMKTVRRIKFWPSILHCYYWTMRRRFGKTLKPPVVRLHLRCLTTFDAPKQPSHLLKYLRHREFRFQPYKCWPAILYTGDVRVLFLRCISGIHTLYPPIAISANWNWLLQLISQHFQPSQAYRRCCQR